MDNQDAIIEKIRKLLALADGNKNENEREVAMRFALELLGKHNLDMAQVEGHFKVDLEEVEGRFRLERWVAYIVEAVCRLYYTGYYVSANDRPVFVGTFENIAVSINVAEWLIDSVRKESNRLYKDNYSRRSFRVGAGYTILVRAADLVAQEKMAESARGNGTSLIVLRDQLERANEEYIARLGLPNRASRSVRVDESSFNRGSSYGESVRLGKQAKRIPQFV